MNDPMPIVGVVMVLHQGPSCVTALLDGERRLFPSLEAVFRAAVHLLDRASGRPPRAIQVSLPNLERRLR